MSANSLEHHSAQVNGIKQHYVKAGSGPAVMLLHGWPQTWYEWRHVIRLLEGKFTVIAPDLRGFGYSSKPASGYDAATIATDLAALSAHLGLKDATVIGNDWGAVFGYVYAASHPDELDGLCLLAPYLGNRIVTNEIARAPGLAAWQPGELAEADEERRLWRYVKNRHAGSPPLYLGFGREDRFSAAHELLAAALPADSVNVIPGGHEWPIWSSLWENFLDSRFI